ncbi:MAG: hypothetical protein JWQ33_659 [Ramlibacter sp.]|nr:hypothetical protein [Ramlibacter sp.]
MFSSFQSTPASTAAPSHGQPEAAGWANEMDDVALGCECADPALQIACWGKEADEPAQSGLSAS